MGLDDETLTGPIIYVRSLRVRAVKAMVRLCRCEGLPELSMFVFAIGNKHPCVNMCREIKLTLVLFCNIFYLIFFRNNMNENFVIYCLTFYLKTSLAYLTGGRFLGRT